MLIRNDHHFFTSIPEVTEIMKPLKRLGIIYFHYYRVDYNGGRIILTSSYHNIKSYFDEKRYLTANCDSHPKNYNRQVVLWSTLPNQYLFESIRQTNVDHGIFMIEPSSEY